MLPSRRFLLGIAACLVLHGQQPPNPLQYLSPPRKTYGLHPLIFDTPERQALARELHIRPTAFPNFASHYYVKLLREGTQMAIVDAETGVIHPSPFATATSPFALPPPNWDPEQPRFMQVSNLLAVPNVCPQGPESCASFYFLWEENRFRLLQSIPTSATPTIPKVSPLLGRWTGKWGYTNGMEMVVESFTLSFTEHSGKLSGVYTATGKGSANQFRITQITATKVDKSTYRMNVGDECWNVSIQGNELQGMRNGGPCTALGIGSGARLVALDAKRTP